jgi:hypothetical protein
MIQYLIQSLKNLNKKIEDEINSIDEYLIPIAHGNYMAWKAEVSETVKKGLAEKVKEHNDKHGDKKGKRVTQGMLESVFKRGVGAYNTNPSSVRPNVSSPDQWAYARVNAFLYAVRSGRYRSGRFDRDLLPKDHPLSSDKEK